MTMDLAVILELGNRTRLIVLGRRPPIMPTEKNDLIRLQMNALGVIDFDQGSISLDAVLYDSRLAGKFPITGSMALRVNWGGSGSSPCRSAASTRRSSRRRASRRSSGWPSRFSNSSDFRLRAERTSRSRRTRCSSAQESSCTSSAGGFSIAGMLGYDVLIQFDPFGFIADFHASVQLKRGSHNLFKVKVEGELRGPRPLHIRGKATFEIFWCDFSIRVDQTFIAGERRPRLPPVNVTEQLVAALNDRRNWSGQLAETDAAW